MANKIKERFILTSSVAKIWIYFRQIARFNKEKYEIEPTIKKFLGEDVSESRKKELAKLMKEAWIKYQWDFSEFFQFDYEHYDSKKKKSFVAEHEKDHFCLMVNNSKEASILRDKWNTYNIFKKYFHRDACHITCANDLCSKEFAEFSSKHHDFIIKPEFSSLGRGIRVLHTTGADDARKQMEAIFEEEPNESFIIEELIKQSASIGQFNPDSVNTLRVQTVKIDNEVRILHPMLRIGKKGSVVDNAGQGGILGLVDKSTKKICAACDKLGNQFTHHPDSGLELIGFEIPYWDEAIALSKELAMVLPNVCYSGWDLALTDNGWVMIEGNDKAQFGFQLPRQEGFRDEFEQIIRDYFKASK